MSPGYVNSAQTSHLDPGAVADTYFTNRINPTSRKVICRDANVGGRTNSGSLAAAGPSSLSSSLDKIVVDLVDRDDAFAL